MMPKRTRSLVRAAATLLAAADCYEAMARSGIFPRALLPTLPKIAGTLFDMIADGTLLLHAFYTLYRMLTGFALAIVVGLPLGVLMGRFRRIENFFLPLTSALMPIPSLAWVPVFIMWFGLGNTAAMALVFYAAAFPLILNAWTGMRSVNRIWLRAASAMGADDRTLFLKVVLPGALPFVIAGLRQAFARAWIAVVGGEMIAATSWGLGWLIFDSKEFLNTDIMIATLVAIGVLGLVFERVVFQSLERRTVGRWGMVRMAGA